jgi:hypothetical protein
MTTPPQHSDEELHKIVRRVLCEPHGAMWNVQAPDGTELYEDTYENALVAELKKREAAARLKGYEAGVGAGIPTEKLKAVDTIAQLHKEQPHEG